MYTTLLKANGRMLFSLYLIYSFIHSIIQLMLCWAPISNKHKKHRWAALRRPGEEDTERSGSLITSQDMMESWDRGQKPCQVQTTYDTKSVEEACRQVTPAEWGGGLWVILFSFKIFLFAFCNVLSISNKVKIALLDLHLERLYGYYVLIDYFSFWNKVKLIERL
jgi:hypothetical protein